MRTLFSLHRSYTQSTTIVWNLFKTARNSFTIFVILLLLLAEAIINVSLLCNYFSCSNQITVVTQKEFFLFTACYLLGLNAADSLGQIRYKFSRRHDAPEYVIAFMDVCVGSGCYLMLKSMYVCTVLLHFAKRTRD